MEQVISLPPMPYPADALQPFLSARAVTFHRRKQHRYLQRTNEIGGKGVAVGSLLRTIDEAKRGLARGWDPQLEELVEQASQAWNHALMWLSMAPMSARPRMPREIAVLEEEWKSTAASLVASGWVWLVQRPEGGIAVESTCDTEQPETGTPLACMDMWEHAYYLDYPDGKVAYVDAWWNHLSDWTTAEQISAGHLPRDLL
jgi:Fe-Mn family superoxide dismutase